MKSDYYKLISRAVEEGITFGLNRAYKHTPTPKRETIDDSIHQEIMNALCEVFKFSDSSDED